MSTVTRRGLLAGAGAGALLAACTDGDGQPSADAGDPFSGVEVDVAVVGAGLAGLTAATELKKLGHSVHVIEADERVGGRIWTVKSDSGVMIDWGAHFVGPQQQRILALANDLGVPIYPTFNTGLNLQFFDGVRKTYPGRILDLDSAVLVEFQNASDMLNAMAATLDPATPWTADKAEEWDSQTFWTWSRANTTLRDSRAVLDLAVAALFSVESRDVSLLYVLFYIRSAGSLDVLIDTDNGAQESQFEGGTQQIPDQLAKTLGDDALTLSSPVRGIVTDAAGKRTVVYSDRVTVIARRVIVAVPPPMIPRIVFNPPLSALKDQLYQRLPMGSVGKVIAIYDTPFWRDDNLTGQMTSDVGPVKITFDVSPTSGKPGVMLGFVDGQDARNFGPRAADERKSMVLAQFASWFGDKANSPSEYLDIHWDALPLHRGCPVAVPGPGAIIGFQDALRRSEGTVHFASTETALEWSGYMDGAIQAGQLTAAEVDSALSS